MATATKAKTTVNIKEVSNIRPDRLVAGHRLCPGCGISIILRQVFSAIDEPIVVGNATGCLEVCSAEYPQTSWSVPWIHNAFANAAATLSGVETMYRSLKKQGKIPQDKVIKFLAIGGDGGTYDIGLQSLSGTMERGHKIVYICTDNEAYMNTGGQRSGATPFGGRTTTTPVGDLIKGKQQQQKNMTDILTAHHIPYVAQAAPCNWRDLIMKVRKAFACDGPAFINTLSVCPTDWYSDPQKGLIVTQSAIDTCFWPLYEVENGITRITYKPKNKKPITDWLSNQGRFKHFFAKENAWMIHQLQQQVDRQWETLLLREEMSKKLEDKMNQLKSAESPTLEEIPAK